MFKRLLDEKEENWTVCKQECAELLKEIADVFSGKTPLTRVQKDGKFSTFRVSCTFYSSFSL